MAKARTKKLPKKGLRGVSTPDRFVKDGIEARLWPGPTVKDFTAVAIGVKFMDELTMIVTDTERQADRGFPITIMIGKKEALKLAASICQAIAEQEKS
ncbi:MAG: hypothetical protein ABI614_13070 [Planctomycetota bacterium]